MIDFLVKPFFLRRELATKLRFESYLRNRYPDVLEDARNFCTLIRQSKQYKRAKESWKEYQDKSFDVLYAMTSGDRDCNSYGHSRYDVLKEEEKELAGMHVERYNALEDRFSFSSLVETYRNLVREITRNTSYDPSHIMLYSDHVHNGYGKENRWHYVGHGGYSEEHFTEYCTTYDLMCLIGDYCDFSRCDGLPRYNQDKWLKISRSETDKQIYKHAKEKFTKQYEMDPGEKDRLNALFFETFGRKMKAHDPFDQLLAKNMMKRLAG